MRIRDVLRAIKKWLLSPMAVAPPSERAVFWTQIITWSVLFLFFAWRMPEPPHEVPTCPSVLTSLTETVGIPKNWAGLSVGLVILGFIWYLSGWLAWAYTRWPRFFLSTRVLVGGVMGPMARRMGLAVMGIGVVFGFLLQLGCEISG